MFFISGAGKLGTAYAATESYMQTMGVLGNLLPLVMLPEIGGGL